MGIGPKDALCQGVHIAPALGIQHTNGHDPRLPVHAGNTYPVVAHSRRDPGDMGTVAVQVMGIVVIVHVVIASHNLARQIGMSLIHATVKDGNGYGCAASGKVPPSR